MFVAHENRSVGGRVDGFVAVQEQELFRFEMSDEVQIWNSAGEVAEFTVVVTENELESAQAAEGGEKFGEFAGDFGDRDGLMDDVAENREMIWFVEGAEVREAGEQIVLCVQGKELAVVAMSPGVPEVQIGDRENPFVFQKDGAAMIEPDARGDFEA